MKGVVTRFSDYHGYGFIKGEDGRDYFVHLSQIIGRELKSLLQDQEVVFEKYETFKGWQAHDVKVIQIKENESDRITLKKNPFTPQYPISDPNKFAGRVEPFKNAVDAIFNNKNLLITGPRGIGKSSLSYQLLNMTKGETDILNKIGINLGGYEFKSITGDIRCLPATTLVDLVNGLINSLYLYVGRFEVEKESRDTFQLDFKFLKFTNEHKIEKNDISELSSLFIYETEKFYREYDHKYNGVCFLIDEVDTLDESIDIASFLKATVEKFVLDGFNNISFIVTGVTGTITNMINQHPSSHRLFESLELQSMEYKELEEIIESCLKDTGVSIDNNAVDRIIKLSNKYPQPVHLLGYHSFRLDTDNNIDLVDVNEARNFIIKTIKKQEFEDGFQKVGKGIAYPHHLIFGCEHTLV